LILLAAGLAAGGEAQDAAKSAPVQAASLSTSGPARGSSDARRAASIPAGDIVREFDDPHNGDRWLLVYDSTHPAGPGILLRIPALRHDTGTVSVGALARSGGSPARNSDSPGTQDGGPSRISAPIPDPDAARDAEVAVIHAGDRVILEESTPVVEARLEAVAMGPALSGSFFRARLTMGGHVVLAFAIAPGQATLEATPPPQREKGASR
jgi:hypothetical protein